jgi:hypothetical protein
MGMNQASYWEAQENRWHDKYVEAEKYIDRLETKIWNQASRLDRYEAALKEIAKRDPRTSYGTYRAIAEIALGDNNV